MQPIADTSTCASLSVDLDNEWAYLASRGDPAWHEFSSYLAYVIPRILECLRQRGLKITFFVVGRDAEFAFNREALASVSAEGHEIGNHSLRHELWLHQYTESEFESELAQTEELLYTVTGQRPRGFRGPGFNYSEVTIKALAKRGYLYNASTFPSFLGPIARAYHLSKTYFGFEDRARLAHLFGGWREGLKPLRPYRWSFGPASLIEIPVTTCPVFRIPIHLTYVMYLAALSPELARTYFRVAMAMCRCLQVEPSILLHPIDFLTSREAPRLASFPGMGLRESEKRSVLESCLDYLQLNWPICSLERHASLIAQRKNIPIAIIE